MNTPHKPTKITTQKWFDEDPLFLRIVGHLSEKSQGYLVGGYLRDKVLGLTSKDIDFVIDGDPVAVCSGLSDLLSGKSFSLDRERKIARCLVTEEDLQRTVDISPLSTSIEDNLKGRDFTINAMALDIAKLKNESEICFPDDLISSSPGLKDIRDRKIRLVSPSGFQDDGLRLLRAVRLSVELGFSIDERTGKIAGKDADRLEKVKPERIKEEIFQMFSSDVTDALRMMDRLGILRAVFPELISLKGITQNEYHHLDVFEHTICSIEEEEKILTYLEDYFPGLPVLINRHLDQKVEGGCSRLTALRLATLFHDLGKPQKRTKDSGSVHFYDHAQAGYDQVQDILERLRFGKKARKLIGKLVLEHMRPIFLTKEEVISERVVRRFEDRVGDEIVELLILSIADKLSARGTLSSDEDIEKHCQVSRKLMESYLRKPKKEETPPLIDGYDIINMFGLESGPLVGNLLKIAREAHLDGRISTKKEALRLVKSWLERSQRL